jgi:hypothetical protein
VEPLPLGKGTQIWHPRSYKPLEAANNGRQFLLYFGTTSKRAKLRHIIVCAAMRLISLSSCCMKKMLKEADMAYFK